MAWHKAVIAVVKAYREKYSLLKRVKLLPSRSNSLTR